MLFESYQPDFLTNFIVRAHLLQNRPQARRLLLQCSRFPFQRIFSLSLRTNNRLRIKSASTVDVGVI